MKKEVETSKLNLSIFLLQPSRPIFCTTKNEDGSDHAAPFSWIMPISCEPPRVAFAMQNERGSKHSQTLQNIVRENEFVINVPKMGQEFALVQSSYMLVSHKTKFDRTGSARENAKVVSPPSMADCVAFLECKVFEVLDAVGDHTLILADVVSASYEEKCYDEMLCPVISEFKPIISLKEYRHDDHQRHIFLDTSKEYEVIVPYEKEIKD